MTDIPQIGKCAGCQKAARLHDSACADCRARFGSRCGPIFARIRVDPVFALVCYEMLSNPDVKSIFVQWFGLPEGCEAV